MRKITKEGFNVVVFFTVIFFSLRLTEILVLYYHCLKTSEKKIVFLTYKFKDLNIFEGLGKQGKRYYHMNCRLLYGLLAFASTVLLSHKT